MKLVGHLIPMIFLSLVGCTFSAPQIEGLAELFRKETLAGYSWIAYVGSTTSGVTAVDYNGAVVFVNKEGDAIGFDGWRITSVVGFGMPTPLRIEVDSSEVEFRRGGFLDRHRCSSWEQRWEPRIEWLQVCEADFPYENRITLDDEGRIIEINQAMSADGARVVLRKQ